MKLSKTTAIIGLIVAVFSISCATQSAVYQKNPTGITLPHGENILDIQICTDEIIRVQYRPKTIIAKDTNLAVIHSWKPIPFKVESKGPDVVLSTSTLKIMIDTATALMTYYTPNDSLLLREKNRTVKPSPEGKYSKITQEWQSDPEAALYGLGQLQNNTLNLANRRDTLVQTNTVAVNPFLLSTDGYGILWNNYSKTIYSNTNGQTAFESDAGDEVDYYFMAGSTLDTIVRNYRIATGTAPMFGKWAYGYWQSKERYKSDKEILAVAKEYRDRNIPIDNIVQDWNYWADITNGETYKATYTKNWSSMEFHPSTYLDPAATIKTLQDKYNLHYMISIWPIHGPGTQIYKTMEQKKHLFAPEHWTKSRLYDASSKEARDLYWKFLNDGLVSKGVDALWMDGTEPEIANPESKALSEQNIKKVEGAAIGPMAQYLNTYSLLTTSGVYNNWRKNYPDKRAFILTRSGFTGQQRNAAATWSGDITANWDVLQKQISSGLNFSISGIPYWTTDIGAFFVKGHGVPGIGPGLYEGSQQEAYRELYVRWFQFGAFCPLFRSHGTQTPREVWQFGEPGDWAYESLVKFDKLRYRLLPYIYSLAWKVTNDHYTLLRPLAMNYKEDRKVWDIKNQFMFGPSFMAIPVTEHQYFPLESDPSKNIATVRETEVYLPENSKWYDFWTGEIQNGGQIISRKTPIDIMPLYVPEGSIVPMGPDKQYASEKAEDPIELRVYTGKNSSFELYEDENDTNNYEKGVYATIKFEWNEASQELTIHKRKGEFPGMLQTRTLHVVWVSSQHGTGAETTLNSDVQVTYTGEKIVIKK